MQLPINHIVQHTLFNSPLHSANPLYGSGNVLNTAERHYHHFNPYNSITIRCLWVLQIESNVTSYFCYLRQVLMPYQENLVLCLLKFHC